MTATNDSNNHPDTTIIKGKADVTATVSVIIAGQTYSVVVDDLGDFTIEVPKQVVGTIINVSSKLNNYTKTAPVTVTDVEADAYQTTVNDIKKPYGRATTAQEVFEAIKILEYPEDGDQPVLNIKQGVTLPNGRKSGEHLVPVIITYPDGSTKTVDVKVTVGVQPHNNKYQPIVENEVVQVGGTIDLTDNITNINNLPFGTIVKDTTVTPIDTNVVGTYIGQLTVTYPDKTKDIVNVTVIVQEEPLKDNEKYTAIGGVVDKNKEETLTEEDIKAAVEITPKPEEGAVVNISITSPLPTTGMDNKVKVLITYSDNTTDVVTVIVNFHAPEVPLAKEKSWSLASLIVTLLSIAAMVVGLLAKTIKIDETGVELVRNKVYKVVTVLFGVATMVYFLATNNLSLPMKLFNETTLISSIMTVVTMASLALGLIWRED
jgi:Rib/alpha/Esp surface antigen-like repeat protein